MIYVMFLSEMKILILIFKVWRYRYIENNKKKIRLYGYIVNNIFKRNI